MARAPSRPRPAQPPDDASLAGPHDPAADPDAPPYDPSAVEEGTILEHAGSGTAPADVLESLRDGGALRPDEEGLQGLDLRPRPIVIDATDGLPRPADDDADHAPLPPLEDDTFVCTEGGRFRLYRLGGGVDADHASLPPLPDFFEGDEATLVPDCLSVNGQIAWRDPATGAWYRRDRPACAHYVERLIPATAMITAGHTTQPVSLKRRCVLLNVDMTDSSLFACSARTPPDLVSAERLAARARRKREEAALPPVPMFKEAPSAPARVFPLPAESLVSMEAHAASSLFEAFPPYDASQGACLFFGASHVEPSPTIVLARDPSVIFFPDADYQPDGKRFEGVTYTSVRTGKTRTWAASLQGETIARFQHERGDSFTDLEPFVAFTWHGTIDGLVRELTAGRNVAVVCYHQETAARVLADLRARIARLRVELAPPPAPPTPPAPSASPPSLRSSTATKRTKKAKPA